MPNFHRDIDEATAHLQNQPADAAREAAYRQVVREMAEDGPARQWTLVAFNAGVEWGRADERARLTAPEMVERVAEALFEEQCGAKRDPETNDIEPWLPLARAALRALAEEATE